MVGTQLLRSSVFLRSWLTQLWKLEILKSSGQAGDHGGVVYFATQVQNQSGDSFLFSLGGFRVFFPLKAFNGMNEVHQYFERKSAYEKSTDIKINLI